MRKSLVAFLTAAISALAGCSTVQLPKVDTSRPLEVDRGFFAEPIRQNGQLLDGKDTLMQLSSTKEGEHALRNLDMTMTATMITAGVGGYLIGYGVFEKDSDRRATLVGSGAAVFIGSLFVANIAKQQLANSADIYNRRFKTGLTPIRGGAAALFETSF